MAHDEKLIGRIREVLEGQQGITEQNMFGWVCFLFKGNMLCGCDLTHGLSVRVGPDQLRKGDEAQACGRDGPHRGSAEGFGLR